MFDLWVTALCNVFGGLLALLPPIPADESPTLTVPLLSLLPDAGVVVDKIIGTLCAGPLVDAGLFTEFQMRSYENQCRVSKVNPYEETRRPLVSACDCDLPPDELVEAYLGDTPFIELFKTAVPFELPQQTRFEHHWIVGGTGHGKTNAIANMLIDDLQRVADCEASVVVINSQNSLIPMLSQLPVFAEGDLLDGKLVLIDAADVEYPVALNLFDVGLKRLDSYSLLDRERLLNTAAEVMEFILQSLLGAEMTSRQSTLFGFALQAMQLIPNATIHTFRELMEPNGRRKFAPYLAKLEGRARDFFETQFDAAIFAQTKQQVVARLFAICENRTFDRMLSNPASKLDLFTEINAGKLILINTAKDLLKQQGTEIFGRFFLALIAQAAQERATLPPSERLPCFVYIDECQDYLATDSNFTMILEQARKQNVGIIAAHQYVTQLIAENVGQPLCQHEHQIRRRCERQGRLRACPQYAVRAGVHCRAAARQLRHLCAQHDEERDFAQIPAAAPLQAHAQGTIRGRSGSQSRTIRRTLHADPEPTVRTQRRFGYAKYCRDHRADRTRSAANR